MIRFILSVMLIVRAMSGEAPLVVPSSQPSLQPEQQAPRVVLGVMVEEGAAFDGPPSVHVTRVVPGSTSERLGLLADDRIVSINGQPGNTIAAFRAATATIKPGGTLTVDIFRAGKAQQLSGNIDAPPRPKDILVDTERIKSDTASVRELAEKVRMRGDLEEMLRLLREFETGLPEVAAEYKRLYPKGTFDIQIHINIRSDPASSEQVPLAPASVPSTPASTEAPKPETKKP